MADQEVYFRSVEEWQDFVESGLDQYRHLIGDVRALVAWLFQESESISSKQICDLVTDAAKWRKLKNNPTLLINSSDHQELFERIEVRIFVAKQLKRRMRTFLLKKEEQRLAYHSKRWKAHMEKEQGWKKNHTETERRVSSSVPPPLQGEAQA